MSQTAITIFIITVVLVLVFCVLTVIMFRVLKVIGDILITMHVDLLGPSRTYQRSRRTKAPNLHHEENLGVCKGPSIEPLWSLIVGIWDIIEATLGLGVRAWGLR